MSESKPPREFVMPTDTRGTHTFVTEISQAQYAALGFKVWPGYPTPFTRQTAPGAIPSGTRITKVRAEPDDTRPIGAGGVVLGSFRVAVRPEIGYFVEWDDRPKLAVFVIGWKIAAA